MGGIFAWFLWFRYISVKVCPVNMHLALHLWDFDEKSPNLLWKRTKSFEISSFSPSEALMNVEALSITTNLQILY